MSIKRSVFVGGLEIGGHAPISIQSMTNTLTTDVAATIAQIQALAEAGCDLVRISVYDQECAKAVPALVRNSPVPLVADIHFDHTLAVASVEGGIAKLRINPGNIGKQEHVRRVADCAKAHKVPIRIGVNAGSLPRHLVDAHGGATPQAMVAAAQEHVELLEAAGFTDIVLSLKASDLRLCVDAYRLADKTFDYPLHVGITEAGLPGSGTVKSAIGIGALLLDGIGNTIRVSLTGSPLPEAAAAHEILRALRLNAGLQLISCPTCGRTRYDVEAVAREVERRLGHIKVPVKVAVMGCVVNGLGEARDADVAYCGGDGAGAIYVRGAFVERVTGAPTEALVAHVFKFLNLQA